MYFTDSGPWGETSIQNPRGSVFSITPDGQLLQPLAYECLAFPSGIALSHDESMFYVCETMNNRVVRFVQKPTGVFHFAAFHQFSGGFLPTTIACDSNGYLFVGRADPVSGAARKEESLVSVLSPWSGKEVAEIRIPGSTVSGLAFDKEKKNLLVCEASTNTIYKLNIFE